jgi:hypothetical protein
MAKAKGKPKTKKRRAAGPELPRDQSELLAEVLARLNGLIFLLADTLPRPATPSEDATRKGKKLKPLGRQEELSVRLAQAGLRANEIAAFTVRAPSNIRRDMSRGRKQGRLPK